MDNLNKEDFELEDFKNNLMNRAYTTEWYNKLNPEERALFHIRLIYVEYLYGINMNNILKHLNRPMKKTVYKLYNKLNNTYSDEYLSLKELRIGCNVEKLKNELKWKYNKVYIIHKEEYLISGDEYIKINNK